MSESEKTPMDKRNNSSRQQLTLPSSRAGNESGGSVSKFPGSYQKRDFAYNAPSETTVSKKYPQPREKIGFKDNGTKKFSSNQRRDSNGNGQVSCEGRQSKKLSQALEGVYDMGSLLQSSSYGTSQRRCSDGSARGRMNSAQGLETGYRPYRDRNVGYPRYKSAKGTHSKELFLQANCQFVVRKNGDYAIHTVNPDTLVDWDLIEQVRIFDHEVPSCPICLYPPKAAKITRCGHIYCWPCILHYMSLYDENYVNCPICFARVREKDLKSVMALQTICFNVGQEITMKLMKKGRGQTLVSPRLIWNSEHQRPFSATDVENATYAKLLIADLNYIQKILDAELEELLMLMQEDNPDTLEGSFITAAMKSLEERAVKLKSIDVESAESTESELQLCTSDETSADMLSPVQTTSSVKTIIKYTSAFSDEEAPEPSPTLVELPIDACEKSKDPDVETVIPATSDLTTMPTDASETVDHDDNLKLTREVNQLEPKALYYRKKREKADAAYFYQSADGQHIYLHGLNVSCLKAQYSDLANCPDELTAKIIDLERIFMDEELRKKYRWLNHLPLTCEFMMAELDIKPPVVSQEVLDLFADDVLKRQEERERKRHYDNKRTQRIQNEECRKMGIDPHSRIVRSEFKRGKHPTNISSIDAAFSSMPSANQWNQESSISPPNSLTSEDPIEGVSRNSCSSEDASIPSVSFAQMLKMGNPKPTPPGVVEKSSQPLGDKKETNGSDSSGEELARPPAFRYALMCDIGEKLAELDRAGNNEEGFDETANSGKKKKKKSKKLLFTSGHMFHNKH